MSPIFTLIALIFFLFNVLALGMFWWDKRKAIANQRRISEKQLFVWSLLGGLGALTAIVQLNHKNKKNRFLAVALPLIAISVLGQTVLLYLLVV